ncbi:sugar phosphate isomerase/epimerase family protein [Haloarcula japonica]|uniref:Xylose isomerase domain-containing protein n=1 Tax=Haloarcula japonica (strain ATCC 49778 / DSM 6131 / JCM 7785 / NBRC 101032 / NCIMB 13157 / TR-1) TaxID=1227453 RepID=M0L8G9_HALJT|nr:sugar phosphate isomerase/epimerase [Haloarcula japonica]EMA29861.1 xylose isomerase domain-containing protein [Haloarcula japonica DSM 6131]
MNLVGKCPPSPDALAGAADRGFDSVELYLRPSDLDSVEATAETVERSPVTALSVHTLHARPDDPEPFQRSDALADRLDAYLVVHSQYAQNTHTPQLDAYGFTAPYGYENNPGMSVHSLQNLVLGRGHDLVLDTAHLYMAEPAYLDALSGLLREYGDRIQVVHFADSTSLEDGLAFGDGDVPLEGTADVLDAHFDGAVVLEVMPDDQADARRRVLEWLG